MISDLKGAQRYMTQCYQDAMNYSVLKQLNLSHCPNQPFTFKKFQHLKRFV